VKTLKVGVTGGIGSGKTTVCKIFEALDIPVYYADARAKWLMNHDPVLMADLRYTFGPEVFQHGSLNRAFLAKKVFQNRASLARLNQLVHPRVADDSLQWYLDQTTPFAIKEAALTIEIGEHKNLDALIVVTAPESVRIARVMKRDQITEAQVRARMSHQLPQEQKDALADYLIHNDGQQLLIPQVLSVYKSLLSIHQ